FSWSCDHRALHSFPTRRSSDLGPVILLRMLPRELHPLLPRKLCPVLPRVLPLPRALPHLLSRVPCLRLRWPLGRLPTVPLPGALDRKSTRLNSSHVKISYAVFC